MPQINRRVRANIRTKVNNAKIRHEKRDGRDVIVVPSATLPDDVVMNGVLYPAAEIEKSYQSLNSTPAPLGHPMVNGMFVSAKSPLGLNIGYFGAWNANVRRDNGRVMLDKIIDVERASESKLGQRVLAAIEKGDPIHTSTGVLMNLKKCESSDLAEYEAADMEFDHDAILLDEQGAATPEQGVGMLVNKADDHGDTVAVINSDLGESLEREMDYIGMDFVRFLDRMEKVSKWEAMKAQVLKALGLGGADEETSNLQEEEDMKKEELDAALAPLAASISALTNSVADLAAKADATSAKLNALEAAATATAAAERDKLVNQIVEAKLLTKELAEGTPVDTLKALLANTSSRPRAGDGVTRGFMGVDNKAPDVSPLAN